MRLFNLRQHRFHSFTEAPPPYAILSHRWTADEPSIVDIERGSIDSIRTGTNKVYAFARYVSKHFDYIDWIWVDSCCIKQTDSAELSEAVNLMFTWYRNAVVCIAYMADVPDAANPDLFKASEWFTRGWTLQELLASTVLLFLSEQWQIIGFKGIADRLHRGLDTGPNLEVDVAELCKIPAPVVHDFQNAANLQYEEKLAWMAGRQTLRAEDKTYALFGIFGVSPGANYGEQHDGARLRLRRAIREKAEEAAPSARTSKALLHVLPYPRDPSFITRPEVEDLQARLASPGTNVALVGLGGIGKTQVAIECCYQLMKQNTQHVLWLHASTAERFDVEVWQMTRDLNIPGCMDQNADHHQLLRTWLLDGSREWLVVLDNLDEADHMKALPNAKARVGGHTRYATIPQCSNGRLLITSRRQNVATQFVDRQHLICLQPNDKHALALLERRLELQPPITILKTLAAMLGHIPLAISQAAAYINSRQPRLTVESYLEQITKNDRSLAKLLMHTTDELRRDIHEAKNSILLTWQVSFNHLYTTRRSAADLLAMMSLLDPQGIPSYLFRPTTEFQEGQDFDLKSNGPGDLEYDFEQDVAILKDFSFVSEIDNGSSLRMHRLVHVAARAWLSMKDEIENWQVVCLQHLTKHLHSQVYSICLSDHALIAHISCIYPWQLGSAVGRLLQAAILFRASLLLGDCGWYQQAQGFAGKALGIWTTELGEDDHLTVQSMSELARIHRKMGRYQDAEELQKRCVAAQSRTLPRWSIDRIRELRRLGSLYIFRSNWDSAEEILPTLLEACQAEYGDRHLETLSVMVELGVLRRNQDRVDVAESIHCVALTTSEIVFGNASPFTMWVITELAVTYIRGDRLREASMLTKRIIRDRPEHANDGHWSLLEGQLRLAIALLDADLRQDALALITHTLRACIRRFGFHHPMTTQTWSVFVWSQEGNNDHQQADARSSQVDIVHWHRESSSAESVEHTSHLPSRGNA